MLACAASNTGGSTFTQTGGAAGQAGGGTTTTTATGAGGNGVGVTSSTTTIMTTGVGGGTGSGGSGPNDPDASCLATKEHVDQIPVDVFVIQDKSGSMECPAADDRCSNPPTPRVMPTRWDAFTAAVNGFVNAPTSNGVGVGIGFFPLNGGDNCNAGAYAMPTVPIAMLPGNAGAITSAITATGPNGGTPTLPALTGALDYARTYTMNTPGRSAAVLLVTDGIPNGCSSTIPGAAMVAGQAFAGTPSIKTYVVGLGDTAALDQIALAGSGNMTHYFPATGDVTGQLTAVLKEITGAITCKYTIPMTKTIDPNLVNVQVTVGGGATINVGRVMDISGCGPAGGWYYDNPTHPTQIVLCDQSCDPVKTTPGSAVQVLYGCPWVPPAVH
jgi:Mg-chelatase subunit ChlD